MRSSVSGSQQDGHGFAGFTAKRPPPVRLRHAHTSPRLIPASPDVEGLNKVDAMRVFKAEGARTSKMMQSLVRTNAALQAEMNEARVAVDVMKRARDSMLFRLRAEKLKLQKDRKLAELRWVIFFQVYRQEVELEDMAKTQEEDTMQLRSDLDDLSQSRDELQRKLNQARLENRGILKRLNTFEAKDKESKAGDKARVMQIKHAHAVKLGLEQQAVDKHQANEELAKQNEKLERKTLILMEKHHEAEIEALKAKQQEKMNVAAATCMQKVARGRQARTRRELEKTQDRLQHTQKMAELSTKAAHQQMELESKMSGGSNKSLAGKEPMTIVGRDGVERKLKEALTVILQRIHRESIGFDSRMSGGKFFEGGGVASLATGRPEAAALGLAAYLKVDEFELFERLNKGVKAIEEEFAKHGTPEDQECIRYVLYEKAGSSKVKFANGLRDVGRDPLSFQDFCGHPNAQRAGLRAAHVLALRLYTTAAYKSLNIPLRNLKREDAHPFSATVFFLTDGIRRLRAIEADSEQAAKKKEQEESKKRRKDMSRMSSMLKTADTSLWRGMRNMGTTTEFEENGGSECAPMSTTPDPAIAISYGQSSSALLFKVVASSFMNRGADISFLSAFPEEREFLYTPLTYLRPTGRKETVKFAANEAHDDSPEMQFVVMEVEPQM